MISRRRRLIFLVGLADRRDCFSKKKRLNGSICDRKSVNNPENCLKCLIQKSVPLCFVNVETIIPFVHDPLSLNYQVLPRGLFERKGIREIDGFNVPFQGVRKLLPLVFVYGHQVGNHLRVLTFEKVVFIFSLIFDLIVYFLLKCVKETASMEQKALNNKKFEILRNDDLFLDKVFHDVGEKISFETRQRKRLRISMVFEHLVWLERIVVFCG